MYMTFEEFKKYVDENRFIVQRLTPTKFEVYSIEQSADGKFYLRRHGGPYIMRGYGYSKPLAVLEEFATKLGKEYRQYVMERQRFIEM